MPPWPGSITTRWVLGGNFARFSAKAAGAMAPVIAPRAPPLKRRKAARLPIPSSRSLRIATASPARQSRSNAYRLTTYPLVEENAISICNFAIKFLQQKSAAPLNRAIRSSAIWLTRRFEIRPLVGPRLKRAAAIPGDESPAAPAAAPNAAAFQRARRPVADDG